MFASYAVDECRFVLVLPHSLFLQRSFFFIKSKWTMLKMLCSFTFFFISCYSFSFYSRTRDSAPSYVSLCVRPSVRPSVTFLNHRSGCFCLIYGGLLESCMCEWFVEVPMPHRPGLLTFVELVLMRLHISERGWVHGSIAWSVSLWCDVFRNTISRI